MLFIVLESFMQTSVALRKFGNPFSHLLSDLRKSFVLKICCHILNFPGMRFIVLNHIREKCLCFIFVSTIMTTRCMMLIMIVVFVIAVWNQISILITKNMHPCNLLLGIKKLIF